ncbi:hypothetical protein GCM10009551_053740 [Nocardiopsis tropica]|uniref:hypothetical protein n=1 Tax=Tsukamurella strandjordii TaxID=147577 RepID=UPI0031DA957C
MDEATRLFVKMTFAALAAGVDAFGPGGRLATPAVAPQAPAKPEGDGEGKTADGRGTAAQAQVNDQRRLAAADARVLKLLSDANVSRETNLSKMKITYASALEDYKLLKDDAGSPAGAAVLRSALEKRLQEATTILRDADADARRLAQAIKDINYDPVTTLSGMGSVPSELPPPRDPGEVIKGLPGVNPDKTDYSGNGTLPSDAAQIFFWLKDHPEALKLMKHYAGNTGEPVVLPTELVDKWSGEETQNYGPDASGVTPTPIAVRIRSQVDAAIQEARAKARATGQPVTISKTSGYDLVAGADPDMVRSLGRFQVSTATTVHMNPDGTYSLTYRPDIADRYDYNGTFPNNSVANIESNFLHFQGENGRARPFLVTGSGSTRVLSGRVQ